MKKGWDVGKVLGPYYDVGEGKFTSLFVENLLQQAATGTGLERCSSGA